MRVSEYIARKLVDLGVRQVFMLTGGGAMFLNDALAHESGLQCIFNHHEQACAIAAEGYARISGKPAVVNVTTGPGGINALNGVFGAWVDSIPMLVVSGQVKRETLMATYHIPGLRQIGDQEADIISMVKGITKYAVMVEDPKTIRYHIEKAWHLSQNGRPGPCWIDVPIDVQTSQIKPDELKGYNLRGDRKEVEPDLPKLCKMVLEKLIGAARPVILTGNGIRLGNAEHEFEQVLRALNIPVVSGWTSVDLIPSDDPLYCGLAGDLGTRAGNFSVQNADVLLILGNRLCLRQVSYNWNTFARHAYKIQVDIDPVEFEKPTVRPDLPISCHVKKFLNELLRQIHSEGYKSPETTDWLNWCRMRLERYPVVLPHHRVIKDERINPYHFIDRLFTYLNKEAVVVCGDGTANVVTFQAAKIKKGQRVFANTGDASMGYDLPAAIGAAVASDGRSVICLAGDGSLQLNIQEMQTVYHNRLPIKLFIMNNNGYLSIRLSQRNMFHRVTGESPQSGVSFPDVVKIAEAYGLPAIRIGSSNLEVGIQRVLREPGPIVCDVLLDPEQPFEPRIASRQLPDGSIVSSPLEDMFPFLSDEELRENLFIPSLR